MDPCTAPPLFRGAVSADDPSCKDMTNGLAFSIPFSLCPIETAIFLAHCLLLLNCFRVIYVCIFVEVGDLEVGSSLVSWCPDHG